MQLHRSKHGGCMDVGTMRAVAGFCATAALALLLLSSDLSSKTYCAGRPPKVVHDSTQLPNLYCVNGSAFSNTIPSEWETPSVVRERDWEVLQDSRVPESHRPFTPIGVASFLFIQFGAYRSSPSNFSLVGLSPKALHSYGNPTFKCSWVPESGDPVRGTAFVYLPGIKLANQYTGTVIHCTFKIDVGADAAGGSLQIVAEMGSQDQTGLQSVAFTALTERPGDYERELFEEPVKYEVVYCGSPLYGQISPQRVREWVAYHAMVFGARSHFILYDAGGLHEDVRTVLAPWVRLGRVSIVNYRQEARYDSHYHSQAVALNDCLIQAKRMAEWAFFFDVDEYVDVRRGSTLSEVMREVKERRGRRAQQVTMNQMPMNRDHCVRRSGNESKETYQRLWGIEKLVFQRTQVTEWGGWKDHKYAVQTKYMLAAGTHDHEFSMVPEGVSSQRETIAYIGEDQLHYHHYHNTINVRDDLCREFVEPWNKEPKFDNVSHVFDDSMASLADAVRKFEMETIGPQPFID